LIKNKKIKTTHLKELLQLFRVTQQKETKKL
jgi:hypothetical protein